MDWRFSRFQGDRPAFHRALVVAQAVSAVRTTRAFDVVFCLVIRAAIWISRTSRMSPSRDVLEHQQECRTSGLRKRPSRLGRELPRPTTSCRVLVPRMFAESATPSRSYGGAHLPAVRAERADSSPMCPLRARVRTISRQSNGRSTQCRDRRAGSLRRMRTDWATLLRWTIRRCATDTLPSNRAQCSSNNLCSSCGGCNQPTCTGCMVRPCDSPWIAFEGRCLPPRGTAPEGLCP